MTITPPPDGPEFCNKGLQTIGFERGHWDENGGALFEITTKAQMEQVLSADDNFSHLKSILEYLFDRTDGVHYLLNSNFWCNLQWVEQYWNDTKRDTRQKCN